MENFTKCAKLILDREYLECNKELKIMKLMEDGPRILYDSSSQWLEIRDSAIISFGMGLNYYLEHNIVQDLSDSSFPYEITILAQEIERQLSACLMEITLNKLWANKRSREITVAVSAALASMVWSHDAKWMAWSHDAKWTNDDVATYHTFIMSMILRLLNDGRYGSRGIDNIPIVPGL